MHRSALYETTQLGERLVFQRRYLDSIFDRLALPNGGRISLCSEKWFKMSILAALPDNYNVAKQLRKTVPSLD